VSEERQEVFRGHLEECFRHLEAGIISRTRPVSRARTAEKRKIANFCGVDVSTISTWMRTPKLVPQGIQFVKLMHYLDFIGYRVIELDHMPKGRRNFAELIVFGLLSVEDAIKLLGYSTPSSLYGVLQGQAETSEDKDQKMWDAWKERREELERRKEEVRKVGATPTRTRQKAPAQPKAEPKAPNPPQASLLRKPATISIMEGLLALLEEHSLKEFSDSQLADLQLSTDVVLRLSAHLSALSSRLLLLKEGKGNG
jgi:hypothetical protein